VSRLASELAESDFSCLLLSEGDFKMVPVLILI
jgi:hypothetical protein